MTNRPLTPTSPLLTSEEQRSAEAIASAWPLRVPAEYAALIDWTDPSDPLRRQVVPRPEELQVRDAERTDPIGDEAHAPVPGLVHRYPHRALLLVTEDCPVHCRFCFRRARLSTDAAPWADRQDAALAYLTEHPGIHEVILTGGEPLSLAPAELARLREALAAVPHLRLLRVHTRLPAVAPSLVTEERIQALAGRLPLWVVTHFNHPRELTDAARNACARLRAAGAQLLNQSVLLAGVNDDAATLQALFESLLLDFAVRPYYLHHCDLAPGTAHLRVSLARGRLLHEQLRGRLSGLALPRYVLDLPGGDGKVCAEQPGLEESGEGRWKTRSWQGEARDYEEVL